MHTQELTSCCPCHSWYDLPQLTHTGDWLCPGSTYRAHAVGGRLAACCRRVAVIAAARACTVSDGGFVRAVSTRRTCRHRPSARSAHAGAHTCCPCRSWHDGCACSAHAQGRLTRPQSYPTAHTQSVAASLPVLPPVAPLLPQLVHAPSPMAALRAVGTRRTRAAIDIVPRAHAGAPMLPVPLVV